MWVACLHTLLYLITIIAAVPVNEKGLSKRSCISNCVKNGKSYNQCQDQCIHDITKRGCFERCIKELGLDETSCQARCPNNGRKRSFGSDTLKDKSIENLKSINLDLTQLLPDWNKPFDSLEGVENIQHRNDVSESTYLIDDAMETQWKWDRNIIRQFYQELESKVREVTLYF